MFRCLYNNAARNLVCLFCLFYTTSMNIDQIPFCNKINTIKLILNEITWYYFNVHKMNTTFYKSRETGASHLFSLAESEIDYLFE